MMKRSGKKTLSIIVVMAMICTLSLMSVDFAADFGGESIVTPTMDVWFEQNGDSTYINLHGLTIGGQYFVSLYDDANQRIDGPYGYVDFGESMPFDDFGVPILPGNRIIVEAQQPDMSLFTVIDYVVADISVDVVNINTETITGFSNQGPQIQVVVFELDGDTEIAEYSLMADVTDGTFSADFTGVCDIHPLSTGLIVQPDGLGNQTVTNWWAPNPELMVNPMLETMSGYGWSGPVTVVFNEGTPAETSFIIPVEPEFGSFENVDLGVDFYGGLTFKAYDGMTTRLMTVSTLTIEWMDISSDQVMMVAEPDAYIQFIIMEGTFPDVSFPVWVDGTTDETGHLLFDFSTTSATPYDLTMASWGFTRNYDGHNNATLYEWRTSEYVTIYGDLTGDGQLDKADVKLLARAVAGKITLSDYQQIVADVDQDGDVDALDLKALNQLIKQK